MTKTLLIILVNLLLSAPGLAAVYTTTASGGNVSAGTSFTGGVAPNCVSGTDQVIVVAGATLYFDINCQLGSTSAIGLGLRVQGAAGNPGLAVVNTGITVTLNGADKSTNANLQVDRYGEFYPQPGATILMGCPNDNACAFVINGLIEDDIYGNSSPVTWSVPSAQINWNNAQGAFTPSNLFVFDGYLYPNIYVARMAQPWISNSSGTGLGTVGNSSISGFRVISNCTGCFTHEVGTWTAVTSTGAYYVNYDTGTLFFYDSAHSNPTFSVNGNKYLSFNSGSILINANTSYNEGVFTNSVFRYLGSSTPGNGAVLVFGNKQSDTISGGTHRRMKVTNSAFQFTKGPIMVSAYSQGSSADPLLVDSNLSYQISPYGTCNGTCGFITLNNAGADYLTISNNDVRSVQVPGVQPEGLLNCYGLSTYKSSVGDQVINNVVEGGFSLVTAYQVNLCGFPGLLADGNATNGYGYAYSTSNVGTIEGSAANLATVSNNYFGHPYRVLNYDRYMNFTGNFIDGSVHHGFIAAEFADWLSEGVSITGNIFVNAPTDTCMQTGYAARTLIDNLTYANNTCVLTQTGSYLAGIFDFTDSRDAGTSNSPVALTTNLMVYNNLAVSERVSWGRYADDQYGMSRVQLGVADWNDDFAPAVSDYCAGLTDGNGANPHGCTLNRLATFTMGTSEYNTNGSRNVTGVTLANPSSSATQSGRSLVWSYTNPANVKLAWGGGTCTSSRPLLERRSRFWWPSNLQCQQPQRIYCRFWPVVRYQARQLGSVRRFHLHSRSDGRMDHSHQRKRRGTDTSHYQ